MSDQQELGPMAEPPMEGETNEIETKTADALAETIEAGTETIREVAEAMAEAKEEPVDCCFGCFEPLEDGEVNICAQCLADRKPSTEHTTRARKDKKAQRSMEVEKATTEPKLAEVDPSSCCPQCGDPLPAGWTTESPCPKCLRTKCQPPGLVKAAKLLVEAVDQAKDIVAESVESKTVADTIAHKTAERDKAEFEAEVEKMRKDMDALRETVGQFDATEIGGSNISDATVAKAWAAYQEKIEYECSTRVPAWNNSNADAIRSGRLRRKTPPWHLKDYVPANVRLLMFRRDHPDALLIADIEAIDGGFKGTARVYLEREDYAEVSFDDVDVLFGDTVGKPQKIKRRKFRHGGKLAAIAHKIGSDPERAETGSISRALGLLGYGVVAAIATDSDVRDEDSKPKPKTTAQKADAEGLRKTLTANEQKREAPETSPIVSTAGPKVDDETADLRKRLAEYIGKKRIFSIDKVEAAFGRIDRMSATDVRNVGGKLKAIKSSVAWERLAASMSHAGRWSDFAGGSELEKLKAYLWDLVEKAPTDGLRALMQTSLDESNELVPFDDIEAEGAKILKSLDEKLGAVATSLDEYEKQIDTETTE